MNNLHIATIVIIAANVIVSLKGFEDRSFLERFKFEIGSIRSGQNERMFTSGFLHVDYMHLFFNMLTLYFFADVVIADFGPIKYIGIYVISLLAGSLLALFFHRNESYYSAVGASGAVMGILYAAILLQPEKSIAFIFLPIPIPSYVFGIGYLLYTIYGMKNRVGNIGHTAHFGGAVGGYVATLFFKPELFSSDTLMVILLAIPIIIFVILQKMGKI
ncbi:rhomboid family intramembrane serine protease [Spongiimicrobium salis]|uniref:rhomboid family intramembrane serine protease n=1 Tax=Spongiimicrobium salis TaxID=1667022 RepID=UPI00374D2E4D